MDRQQVFEKIADIVVLQLDVDPSTLTEATTFADLDGDSLDLVEIFMAIEDAFGIEIPDDRAGSIGSMADAVDAVVAALA